MDASADGVGAFMEALRKLNGDRLPPSPVRLGTVLEAGHGKLRILCAGLPVELDELYINPELNYQWKKDTGGVDLLRAGDLVVLLTPMGEEQDQEYYLVCKVVRP